ncbi:MAG: ferrous iron transport protein A [Terriglobales bacterium]
MLSQADAGQRYRVSGIYERDRHLLEFLETRGIRPGAEVGLVERNYDKTLSVRTPAGNMILGRPAADKIWVSRLPGRSI